MSNARTTQDADTPRRWTLHSNLGWRHWETLHGSTEDQVESLQVMEVRPGKVLVELEPEEARVLHVLTAGPPQASWRHWWHLGRAKLRSAVADLEATEGDFLDEIIEESTAQNPDFPRLMKQHREGADDAG